MKPVATMVGELRRWRRQRSSPEARAWRRRLVCSPTGADGAQPAFGVLCRGLGIGQVESPHPGFTFTGRGIKVVSGCMEVDLDSGAHLGLELAALEIEAGRLKRLGASLLVVSIAESQRADGSAAWVEVVDAVAKAVAAARRQRLALALRPLMGSSIQDGETLGRLLVHSEAGLSLDLPQLELMGVDPMELVEVSGDRVLHVRLPALAPAGMEAEFESLAPVIAELKRRGYAGRYVIDPPRDAGGLQDLAPWLRLLSLLN